MLTMYHARNFEASAICSYNTSMNKAGLTQRALAKKLNREPSLVAHYELGQRRIDLAEFYCICKACGASPHKEASDLMKAFDQI
jgi:transcriptional regulator with XRE-family HTH domain